jgi:PAS domain S-box-containing protein
MNVQKKLRIIYGVIITGVLAVAILGFMLKIATDRMDAYHEQRYLSNLLADQLRQSSDDLTRFARTYVMTGDARYEKMYWDVLAIRNGKKPRPENYDRIYWDLVLDDNDKPRPDATAVPLRELKDRAGYTVAEFTKLAEAQKNSDGLVKTEEIAMNMVKGRYDDGTGNFTIIGAPDLKAARTLMHNAAYHQTKASIMKPIEEFQKMLDERTKKVTDQSLIRTKTIFWALQAILLGLFFSAVLLFSIKKRQQEQELELSQSLLAEVKERKRSEAALRESEERYRELFDNANDLMFTHDLSRNFTSINKAAEIATGYTLDEALKMNVDSIIAPEHAEITRQMFSSKITGGGHTRYELEIVCKNGSRVPVEIVSRIIYRDGKPVGVQGIARDITDRKRAEEEKEKLQSQLQQAMKMEAVGRLAGGVAHDFNNLLTAIIGNVSLALMKLSPSDPSAGMLVEVKKASERAARLTQQLLAFSRKQIIQPKVLDINDLIAGLMTMLASLIGENIELRTIPGVGLGLVKVDPGQIEQILMNLAVNARDAMPNGGKLLIETVNVDLDAGYCARHPDSSPGRFVMLAVTDTGHGMSEEVRKQIFEPFFTTKPKGSGTGLGLSTIYGAVRQSGGSIEVSSEEGSGTTFRIYLPRVEGEVPKPERDNGPMDLPEGSETVLLVEDEDIVRGLCIKLLERLGYNVIEASNGDEAIEKAKEHGGRIDLLMTDVVMPGMNGRELAEYLVLLHPATKVLFTSGYTDDAIVHHGVLDEGVAFIGKPYSLSDLAKKIRVVLDDA